VGRYPPARGIGKTPQTSVAATRLTGRSPVSHSVWPCGSRPVCLRTFSRPNTATAFRSRAHSWCTGWAPAWHRSLRRLRCKLFAGPIASRFWLYVISLLSAIAAALLGGRAYTVAVS